MSTATCGRRSFSIPGPNAFKFTFEGEIKVRLKARGDCAELTGARHGMGIPAAELPRCSSASSACATRGADPEGSGIGLALVRELVKLHGGEVSFESREREGHALRRSLPAGERHSARRTGSAFRGSSSTTRFGAHAVSRGGAARVPAEEAERASVRTQAEPVPTTGQAADDPARGRQRRTCAITSPLLERYYDVVTVADGQAALDAIAQPDTGSRPDGRQ